jgi:hypothetical protein
MKISYLIGWLKAICSERNFFFLALLFTISLPSYAQEEQTQEIESQGSAPNVKKTSRWQWSLSVVNRTSYRIQEPRVFQMSRFFANGKIIYKFSDHWRLTMEGRIHYDPVERLGFPKRPSFDPRQFLIDGKIKNVSLSIGLQQTVWGQADGLRVLDVINPLDFREFILEDFLDSRRPLWTLRADVPVKSGSLQFIYIPYFAPGRLPGPNDEFGFGESFGLGIINSASGNSSAKLPITVLQTKRPGYRLGSGQFGVRYSRSVRSWDLTANFFHGWEDIPTPNVSIFRPLPLPQITIAPSFDRKTVFGGTAVTNFGPVVLRLEAGWNFRKSAAINQFPPQSGFEKLSQFSGVVGLDYSPRSWLWLSGQYFLQFVSAPERDLLFPRYNHLSSFFIRTNFLRETLKPELFILTGLNRRQYMIRPRITRSFGDHINIGFGVDILGGNPTTPFGFFSDRDRTIIEIKWLK